MLGQQWVTMTLTARGLSGGARPPRLTGFKNLLQAQLAQNSSGFPQNSYADTLIPSVMVSGGKVFRRRPGRGCRALVSGTDVLVRGAPENSLSTSACEGREGEMLSMNEKRALPRH